MIEDYFICVLKSGGQYNQSHVQRMRNQLTNQKTLICLSDLEFEIDGVMVLPLYQNWDGWWSKIELFKLFDFQGRFVYFDLDVTIVGDANVLFTDEFTTWIDPILGFPNINSSVMAWNSHSQPCEVFFELVEDSETIKKKYRRWPKLGDQAFIQDYAKPKVFFDSGLIRSYRRECINSVPDGTVVVVYHGKPKPWEIDNV